MPSVELPQGRIHYVEDGSGPAVVLLHGAFVSARLWREVVPLLAAAGHRVIAPDLPLGAHPEPLRPQTERGPRAVARLVADLLEALDLDDVTLVGNDTGGAIAQLVAADHPERIGRLVLTNCDMLDVFPPAFFRPLFEAAKLPGVLGVLGRALRPRVLRRSPLAFGWLSKRPIPDDVALADLAAARQPGVREDLRRFLQGVTPAETERAADALAGRDLPILLAWAREDRFFRLATARRFAARMRDARLEVIEDSLTFTPEDQPEVLAGHVARFAATAREPVVSGT